MLVYENILTLQIVAFCVLFLNPKWRTAAVILLTTAVFFKFADISAERYHHDVYLVRAAFDTFFAYILFYGAGRTMQPLIFLSMAAYNLLGYFEYPTEYTWIYNSYSPVTNALNILLVLVVIPGILQGIGHVLKGFHTHSSDSLRHGQSGAEDILSHDGTGSAK